MTGRTAHAPGELGGSGRQRPRGPSTASGACLLGGAAPGQDGTGLRPLQRARLGIHLFVWGADWHAASFDLPRVLETCRQLGYAGVELPWLEAVPAAAVARAAHALRDAGLWVTVSTALPPTACLVDPARAAPAVAWLCAATEAAATLGSPLLVGPLLAPVGELPDGAGRGWEAAVGPLAHAVAHGAAAGVRLCLEPLNRFETDTVNTLEQGVALCHAVGPALGLLSDTFHQNIEENDPMAALRAHLPWVGHAHFSENHRGPVGSGHIPWEAVVAVMDQGGYTGRVIVEGFNGRLGALARATCLWRPLAASPVDFAARTAARLLPLLDGAGAPNPASGVGPLSPSADG